MYCGQRVDTEAASDGHAYLADLVSVVNLKGFNTFLLVTLDKKLKLKVDQK